MFVYTVGKAVRMGYVSLVKLSMAKKAYDGLARKFIKNENGETNFYGTVKVSGLGGNPYRDGSYEYYVGEPVVVNDPKGVGAFILAANEMEILNEIVRRRVINYVSSEGKDYGRRTVTLDNYFNNEWKKDITGKEISFHYVWEDKSNSGFSMFGEVFSKYGVKKNTLTSAPTKENLKRTNIYIIVDPDT